MTTTKMTVSLEDLLMLQPDEMLQHDETPSIEELRYKEQLYYDDVRVGMELPKYINKLTMVQLQRWQITMENTDRLHYDHPYSINQQRVPGVLFNGTWRMSILAGWLKNWVLPGGWAWKAKWQVREMVVPGEVTIVWGRVVAKSEKGGLGFVDVEFGIKNQDGIEGCPGSATVVLPIRGGIPVPYPFEPPSEQG
jgi:acyl dehydratase